MQQNARLADFIRAEMEAILQDWEQFAYQSELEQAAKSKGRGPVDEDESSAEVHGSERQTSGFTVMETVSEFRTLRAP